MESWKNFYEPCEVTIDIQCEDLPKDIEHALRTSHSPTPSPAPSLSLHPPTEKQPTCPRQLPTKPSRELRLSLRSPQLRKRFSRVIEDVPGRSSQAERIFSFISNAENGSSSPLCLHGNTGCGKTSLITKVLEFFEENSDTVRTAYLNCMSIRTVNLIYVFLVERFYGGRKGAKGGRAAEALRKSIEGGMGRGEPTRIVVLDEIDHVIGEQNFLYNMLEWLSMGAKLILVLISNVIDLAVRLDGKLQSRWKFETIIFQPYSHTQIESIILYKYRNIRQICTPDAIRYVAKRIYNINSDIRTLDKIYRRITALAPPPPTPTTTTPNDKERLLGIEAIRGLIYDETQVAPLQNSYAIVARIIHLAIKTEIEEVSDRIINSLYKEGQKYPRKEEVLYVLCELQDAGLITLTSRLKSCDVIFSGYGIKIHENLRLYIESIDN